jgi:hypothetical protein
MIVAQWQMQHESLALKTNIMVEFFGNTVKKPIWEISFLPLVNL